MQTATTPFEDETLDALIPEEDDEPEEQDDAAEDEEE